MLVSVFLMKALAKSAITLPPDSSSLVLHVVLKGLSHILDVAIPKTFSPDKSVGKKFFKLQHLRCGTGPLNILYLIQMH